VGLGRLKLIKETVRKCGALTKLAQRVSIDQSTESLEYSLILIQVRSIRSVVPSMARRYVPVSWIFSATVFSYLDSTDAAFRC
jgi:hypothetical protein